MLFTGTYEHTIDSKNRLAVPAEVRSQLQKSLGLAKDQSLSLFVTLGAKGKALCLYTEQGLTRRAAQLEDIDFDEELEDFEYMLFPQSQQVELDKQGRIRLPDKLLAQAGLGTEVVLIGVKDHLEIRDRQAWHAFVQRIMDERPELLMNPRRILRKKEEKGN